VLEKLQGAVFVAHNARFDYSFLRSEFQRLDWHFSAKVLCTVKLSRRLFPAVCGTIWMR
jgi:DNA polymerase-3 subunit epsilon